MAGQPSEPEVNLIAERGVRRSHELARRGTRCVEERVGDEARLFVIDVVTREARTLGVADGAARAVTERRSLLMLHAEVRPSRWRRCDIAHRCHRCTTWSSDA